MDPREQRGYLNNNPGNVRRIPGQPWQGEITDVAQAQNDCQRNEIGLGAMGFCVMVDAAHGFRMLCLDLKAIHDRMGRHTVAGFISVWAPPGDNNNTPGYISRVCEQLGCQPDDDIDLGARATLRALCYAITTVECGGWPYPDDGAMETGITMAGATTTPGWVH